jgi:hypothetical protein
MAERLATFDAAFLLVAVMVIAHVFRRHDVLAGLYGRLQRRVAPGCAPPAAAPTTTRPVAAGARARRPRPRPVRTGSGGRSTAIRAGPRRLPRPLDRNSGRSAPPRRAVRRVKGRSTPARFPIGRTDGPVDSGHVSVRDSPPETSEGTMALKNFTNDEMRLFTDLATGDHREHLEADAALGLALAELDALAPQFREINPKEADEELAAIVADGLAADAAHDHAMRGLHGLLEVVEAITGDAAYGRTRVRLFPGGLAMSQKTYAEEAGEAQRARGRVDEADLALLRGIPLPDGRTAFAIFEAWEQAGARLDAVEKRRLRLGERQSAVLVRSVDVRNRWIRAVRMIESVVAIRGASNPLLDAIRDAEAKADRRAKPAKAEEPVTA